MGITFGAGGNTPVQPCLMLLSAAASAASWLIPAKSLAMSSAALSVIFARFALRWAM